MIQGHWQQYLAESPAERPSGGRGIAYVPELAAVRFTGSTASEFLQGYLTCDTHRLRDDRLMPAAVCNLKGRVVANGWCALENGADVLLVLHASLVERLTQFLAPYLMFSRQTRLADLRPDLVLLASLDLPEAGGLVLDGHRRLLPLDELPAAQALWERHPHVTAETWLATLAADGVPLVSAPVSETFLPQMLNLDTLGALDFEKGCYLGQEVVARAQHRGQVKRRLRRLRWQGPSAPEPGSEVTDAAGRSQGLILQSAGDGTGTGVLLAVLRQDAPDAVRQGETVLTPAPG